MREAFGTIVPLLENGASGWCTCLIWGYVCVCFGKNFHSNHLGQQVLVADYTKVFVLEKYFGSLPHGRYIAA